MTCKHRHSETTHPKCFFKKPKVLFLDIETTAHAGLYWGRVWDTDVVSQTAYGQILSYSAKVGQKCITRGWLHTKGEKGLVKELWRLIDGADYVVAHNGKSFDLKWCLTRFAYYKLPAPSPYKVIDTKLETKRYWNLPSYKLDDIGNYFGLGRKLEHEGMMGLQAKCLAGNKAAWKRLLKYNQRDTELLVKVYNKVKPFNQKLP